MKMKTQSRDEQLARLRMRYAGRGREGRSQMLNEICSEQGYTRKYAIRLLRGTVPQSSGRTSPGPPVRYHGILNVLADIWRAAEQPCGKRLVEALPLWLPHYEKHFNALSRRQRQDLKEISAATTDRMLSVFRRDALHGLSGTRPGNLLRKQIPIQGEVWDEKRPGFLEADSVAHCGGSLAGDFIWSLTYSDLASTWTEGRAVWNKGAHGVLEQTRDVESVLPFPLLGFDFDNGSEWLNWTLIRYLQQRACPVRVTRSRPYHKDDNAHVEQKNWMWPRQLLGYGRLEAPSAVPLINGLFKEAWGPLQNFFLPGMKLREKWRVGSRWVRRHDRAQTAYHRLLNSGHLTTKETRRLRDWYESLDPFVLARDVECRLRSILHSAVHERTLDGGDARAAQ
jgi:hypothetical protein